MISVLGDKSPREWVDLSTCWYYYYYYHNSEFAINTFRVADELPTSGRAPGTKELVEVGKGRGGEGGKEIDHPRGISLNWILRLNSFHPDTSSFGLGIRFV